MILKTNNGKKPECVNQTSIRLKNFNLSIIDWIETFIPITEHGQMYNNFRIYRRLEKIIYQKRIK